MTAPIPTLRKKKKPRCKGCRCYLREQSYAIGLCNLCWLKSLPPEERSAA